MDKHILIHIQHGIQKKQHFLLHQVDQHVQERHLQGGIQLVHVQLKLQVYQLMKEVLKLYMQSGVEVQ